MFSTTPRGRRARILVLLTTHNGAEFLDEQLDTVLGQHDVDVEVLVSDDDSSDGTVELLDRRAAVDARIRVLEPGRFGSSAANFARLIRDCDPSGFDAVALSDQDDVWQPWKLARHFGLLTAPHGPDGGGACAAVSSNVTAFDDTGARRLIMKSQPQRLLDYAFESGGPGSTFLLTPESFALVQRELRRDGSAAALARSHDWLIYALIRASGGRWHIDAEPSVDYRQHDRNVLGANEGASQHWRRLRAIADGSHRDDVRVIVAAALDVADEHQAPRLRWLAERVAGRGPIDRLRLARWCGELRRRHRDRLVLRTLVLAGVW